MPDIEQNTPRPSALDALTGAEFDEMARNEGLGLLRAMGEAERFRDKILVQLRRGSEMLAETRKVSVERLRQIEAVERERDLAVDDVRRVTSEKEAEIEALEARYQREMRRMQSDHEARERQMRDDVERREARMREERDEALESARHSQVESRKIAAAFEVLLDTVQTAVRGTVSGSSALADIVNEFDGLDVGPSDGSVPRAPVVAPPMLTLVATTAAPSGESAAPLPDLDFLDEAFAEDLEEMSGQRSVA